MPDGRIVQVNQTLADWIGQSKQSLLSGVRFLDLLTVPGRIYYETHFAPLMQMQGFIQEVAFDLQRPGRGPLPVLVSANRNRDGALYLITVFDATDRRVYEQELLQARRRAQEAAD